MNKNELVRAIANKAGITLKDAAIALDGFIGAVTDGLKDGEKVQELVGFRDEDELLEVIEKIK